MMTDTELIRLAQQAREKAYSPYSGYTVGAALLCADGTIYTGCNVENASYSATCCAERVALFEAVRDGHRAFSAIAVAGGRKGDAEASFFMPCGVCRQVMGEFCGKDFVVLVTDGKEIRRRTLEQLLPEAFEL